MSTASNHSVLARIARATKTLIRGHARKRSNAMAVHHIETLPTYLRRDIGLPDDADIVDAVEHGLARRATGEEARHHVTLLPHAI